MERRRRLSEILDRDAGIDSDLSDDLIESEVQDSRSKDENLFCIECTDMPVELQCQTCDEDFCRVCFDVIHRSGKRKDHKTNPVEVLVQPNGAKSTTAKDLSSSAILDHDEDFEEADSLTAPASESTSKYLLENLRTAIAYIPLRLNHEERRLLRLLEAALNVSEYTDKIDILTYKSKSKRIVAELKEICSILAGLVVAQDFKKGQQFVEEKNFVDNKQWYQHIFEIGRRYKVMNPEKLRDGFGKLCYMVMDSRFPEIKEHLEFDLYKPIKTIELYLLEKDPQLLDKLFLLDLILTATAEILSQGKSRLQLQREKKAKDHAIEKIASKYLNKLNREEIRQILYSIGDFHSYINFNKNPIKRILDQLEQNFSAEKPLDKNWSLGIKIGLGGARLSHNHETQYYFCHQSLTLWSIIMRDFIKLWKLADEDLLAQTNYRLTETGQGLQRIKAAPQTQRYMYKIVHEVQRKTPVSFIGSSSVHIADSAVPSALYFLDKYIQVPRILIPIDRCLQRIDEDFMKDKHVAGMIKTEFGSVENLKLTILTDFFRHAFNGSGGEDYFNAGSCIDGRLTSAWNWANEISKKNYYKYFLISGFVGFNGSDGW